MDLLAGSQIPQVNSPISGSAEKQVAALRQILNIIRITLQYMLRLAKVYIPNDNQRILGARDDDAGARSQNFDDPLAVLSRECFPERSFISMDE